MLSEISFYSSEALPDLASCGAGAALRSSPPKSPSSFLVPLQSYELHTERDGALKIAIDKTTQVIRSKLPQTTTATANASLQPIRVYAQNQPVHPIAYIKQSRSQQSRWFSSQPRLSTAARSGAKYDRSSFPVSRTSKAISQRGIAPFASTLRPNLTGGALPRSAGGYSLGGASKGVRHFSHTPGCQAQVLQNVNAGIRAFYINGSKARFDGTDPVTGENRFRAISQTEDKVYKQWAKTPSTSLAKGTTLEFRLSPTITALSPSSNEETTLQTSALLHNLSGDFFRTVHDLATISHDLSLLSRFGALPLSLSRTPNGPILAVRFPGCDAESVAHLCDEVGVTRGVIRGDAEWEESKEVEMALLFPFAPSPDKPQERFNGSEIDVGEYFTTPIPREHVDYRSMLSTPSETSEDNSEHLHETATFRSLRPDPASPFGYESLGESAFVPTEELQTPTSTKSQGEEYEGLEGIYRFLQECDDARR